MWSASKLLLSGQKIHQMVEKNTFYPVGMYQLKVNNKKTKTRCKICSQLTIKTPEQHHWHRFGVFNVNFEHISHLVLVFFDYLRFISQLFTNHAGLQRKGEGISVTPHYHFQPLHRHLDISRAITAENSPLHICSRLTRTRKLWFPSASR